MCHHSNLEHRYGVNRQERNCRKAKCHGARLESKKSEFKSYRNFCIWVQRVFATITVQTFAWTAQKSRQCIGTTQMQADSSDKVVFFEMRTQIAACKLNALITHAVLIFQNLQTFWYIFHPETRKYTPISQLQIKLRKDNRKIETDSYLFEKLNFIFGGPRFKIKWDIFSSTTLWK